MDGGGYVVRWSVQSDMYKTLPTYLSFIEVQYFTTSEHTSKEESVK